MEKEPQNILQCMANLSRDTSNSRCPRDWITKLILHIISPQIWHQQSAWVYRCASNTACEQASEWVKKMYSVYHAGAIHLQYLWQWHQRLVFGVVFDVITMLVQCISNTCVIATSIRDALHQHGKLSTFFINWIGFGLYDPMMQCRAEYVLVNMIQRI